MTSAQAAIDQTPEPVKKIAKPPNSPTTKANSQRPPRPRRARSLPVPCCIASSAPPSPRPSPPAPRRPAARSWNLS